MPDTRRTRINTKGTNKKGKPYGALHHKSDSPEYQSWRAMHTRTGNPNYYQYHHYGGRGIKVCDRWFDFRNFYADMGDRPKGYSLDRIDNDGDYEPSNCRWATASGQQRNKRPTGKIGEKGITTRDGWYRVRFRAGEKIIYRERLKTLQEAIDARTKLEQEYTP